MELPKELESFHPVFHISMFKKYMGNISFILPIENVGMKDNLSYEKIPVQIFYCQVCYLRTKEVASVKVLLRKHFVEEATSEDDENMKNIYTHLFEPRENVDQGTNSLLNTLLTMSKHDCYLLLNC